MAGRSLMVEKGMFDAAVACNTRIGNCFYSLKLKFEGRAAKAFANFKPGQFAELDLSTASLPSADMIPNELKDAAYREILLRRPFSFCDVTSKVGQTTVEILYCVLGPATLRMTTLAKADSISVIGPLGNGFHVPEKKKSAILVTGGMGAPPVLHLSKFLKKNYPKIKTIGLAGAKSARDFPFRQIQDKTSKKLKSISGLTINGTRWLIASDNGDIGVKGFVTSQLEKQLAGCNVDAKDTIIYSCGPEPMLAKVAQIAENYGIDCQVSMEQVMACGIGLCQSCAIECKTEKCDESIYRMCCKDGPVFNSREIIFKI
jgi:dihydroorotate dehydrogenase electron transfer subunit